ncbi:MAG: sigma-70 family RNA polymerase sigma factor [Chloroflexi bacterium]|nr:sigma-70 family RNA polymerase sigma factor [Chloroflexota bacterium]
MLKEPELVCQAQAGDRGAFAVLYERYFDKIYRYTVLKVGDRSEAEDMTQQVFLKALKSISSFKWKEVPFSAWLYRIAHNQVVDYFRKKSRRPTADIEKCLIVSGQDTQKLVEIKMSIEQVAIAARRLTPAQQEVISLRFAGEMRIAEVAAAMGKSQGAVKALQHSAILALRKIFHGEDGE